MRVRLLFITLMCFIAILGGNRIFASQVLPTYVEAKPCAVVTDFGGQVELLPQDSFFAMTNGDKFIEKVKMMSSVVNNTNDDIINRIKNMSAMPNNSMATNTTSNSNINLNINIDASKVPSHIDTNELKLALGNQSIKEEIVKSLKSVMSNNNLTQSSGGMMIG